MRILYIATSFPQPDVGATIYTDLAEALCAAGHSITVVVSEQKRNKRCTSAKNERGFDVLRIPVGNYYDVGLIEKGVTTLVMPLKMKRGINKHLKYSIFDLILFESPPITNAGLAAWAKKRFRCPAYLMLKDIFPQNAVDLGIIKRGGLMHRYFAAKERRLYASADTIGCMSDANVRYVLAHHATLDADKVRLFPNTKKLADDIAPDGFPVRRQYNIPQDACVYLFGGNMGRPQYIDLLCEAIIECAGESGVFFVFAGRGTERHKISRTIAEHGIENAVLIEELPRSDYAQVVKECDIGLLTLDPAFTVPNYPSRILSYMEFGKPVLAATDKISDIRQLIANARCGRWVWSGDTGGFIKAVREMAACEKLADMGRSGREYAEEHFSAGRSVAAIGALDRGKPVKSVLHINTQLGTPSGTMPYRIHEGFMKNGWQSAFLTADCADASGYTNVVRIPGQRLPVTLARLLRHFWYGRLLGRDQYYYFPQISFRTVTLRSIVKLIARPPDVIIAYWTNLYFTQKLLHKLSVYFKVPLILYLMDEEPYTGGCHMTFGCVGYLAGCGHCRALKIVHAKDASYRSARRKKRWLERTDVRAVAPTSFIFERLNNSFVFENIPKSMVMLPIDEQIYRPGDKQAARRVLSLPAGKKLILFGGASFKRINKGMTYLIEALRILKTALRDDVHIVLVGNGAIEADIPFDVTYLGYQDTCEKMARAYQACDVFVCPAIQDAGPAMINEAVMCGCPVVCFNTGVATDLIVSAETGYIAEMKNARDLADGIRRILESDKESYLAMAQKCRETGLDRCGMAAQIEKLVGVAYEKAEGAVFS